jgi:hypothetical protein
MSETVELQSTKYILNHSNSLHTYAAKLLDAFQLHLPTCRNRKYVLLTLKLTEGISAQLGSVC